MEEDSKEEVEEDSKEEVEEDSEEEVVILENMAEEAIEEEGGGYLGAD